MRRLPLMIAMFVALAVSFLAMRAGAQDAGGPPDQNAGGPAGGPGDGQRGGPPPAGYHLLPRFVVDKLQLSDDQRQQVNQLEQETKAKLAKILTADQMKIVETARPPRRGGGQAAQQSGQGNGGLGDGGGPGGPGDQGPPN
jgi:Spy/CpxP family protein refolding chaperone